MVSSSFSNFSIKLITHMLLITGSIFMLFPFIWMIATSLKPDDEVLSTELHLLPSGPFPENMGKLNWKNYSDAWKAQPFGYYFLNTIFVSLITTVLQIIFSSMAAYAFAFFRVPFKTPLFYMLLGTMMIPQQALLIPDYIILTKLQWIDTYAALIVPWCASMFSIFFLRQFFMTLPRDLFDAAMVDGCSKLGFYFRILVPLSKPPMISLAILSFLGSWNSFIWPLVVTNSTNLRVIQVGLAYFLEESGTEWALLMAASTFTILPLVIGYFFLQRYFVENQAMTGMKV